MIRWYVSSKVFDMVSISEMMVLICSSRSMLMLLAWAVFVDNVRTLRCLLCILWSVLLVRYWNAVVCWRLDVVDDVVVFRLAMRRRYRLDEDGPVPFEKLTCCLFGCALCAMVVQLVVVRHCSSVGVVMYSAVVAGGMVRQPSWLEVVGGGIFIGKNMVVYYSYVGETCCRHRN